MLEEWVCLNPEVPRGNATDCVINVLAFVSAIEGKERALELSRIANTEGGTSFDKIFDILYEKYKSQKISFGRNSYSTDDGLNMMTKELKPWHGSLVFLFFRPREVGHCVIIAKSPDNDNLSIIDPQTHEVLDAKQYCIKYDVHRIDMLIEKQINLHSPLQIQIRKKVISNPPKRVKKNTIPSIDKKKKTKTKTRRHIRIIRRRGTNRYLRRPGTRQRRNSKTKPKSGPMDISRSAPDRMSGPMDISKSAPDRMSGPMDISVSPTRRGGKTSPLDSLRYVVL